MSPAHCKSGGPPVSPSPRHPVSSRGPGRPPRRVVIEGRAGVTFTAADAAGVLGVSIAALRVYASPSGRAAGRRAGGARVRYATPQEASAWRRWAEPRPPDAPRWRKRD